MLTAALWAGREMRRAPLMTQASSQWEPASLGDGSQLPPDGGVFAAVQGPWAVPPSRFPAMGAAPLHPRFLCR